MRNDRGGRGRRGDSLNNCSRQVSGRQMEAFQVLTALNAHMEPLHPPFIDSLCLRAFCFSVLSFPPLHCEEWDSDISCLLNVEFYLLRVPIVKGTSV